MRLIYPHSEVGFEVILCNQKLPAISKHVQRPRFAGTMSVVARDFVLPKQFVVLNVYIYTHHVPTHVSQNEDFSNPYI